MKKILKTAAIIMALAGMISCDKENSIINGGGKTSEGYLSAKLMVNSDFANAIETAEVEYKDASGKLVTEKVNFASLPTEEAGDYGKLHVYSKEVIFKKFPADVYFTLKVTKKAGLTYTDKASLIYLPEVSSGKKDGSQHQKYKSFSDEIKIGIKPEGVNTILDGVINRINATKAEGKIN